MSAVSLRPARKLAILIILISSSVLGMSATDLHLPGLPDLADLLATSTFKVQATLVVYLAAFGLGHVIIGPLSDHYGRRPVFLGGLTLFTVFSGLCGLATSIDVLLLARTFQGLAGATEAVLVMAIIADLFEERGRIRLMAIYGLVIAFAPGVAPIIGGYIHVLLGWQYNFYLMTSMGALIVVAALMLLVETRSAERRAASQPLGRAVGALMANRPFLVYAVMEAIVLGMIFAFIMESPYIFIEFFGVATENFGYVQFIIIGTYGLGSALVAWLVDYFSARRLVSFGLSLSLIGVLGLVGFGLLQGHQMIPFIIGMSVVLLGLAPLFAVLPALAIGVVGDDTGTGSAVLGGIQMFGAGLIAGIVAVIHNGSPWVLVIAMAVTMSAALALSTAIRFEPKSDGV